MLDEILLWEIIDVSRRRAREIEPRRDYLHTHIQTLTEVLRELLPEQLILFDHRFRHYHRLAYREDLLAAVYWLYGGCGDDGFMDFRACLISLGKDLFFQVLNAPDLLAEIVSQPDFPFMFAEGFQYAAGRVYTEMTSKWMPLPDDYPKTFDMEQLKGWGQPIDYNDREAMQRHFPKILAKFPEMGDYERLLIMRERAEKAVSL